jgi:hypothetical protein
MNEKTRYEIIIEALCRYADGLETQVRTANKATAWQPVTKDEFAHVLARHNVTSPAKPAKRKPGRPRKLA